MRYLTLSLLLPLAGCYGDETTRAYGAADKVWRLSELNGAPFTANATITFPQEGRLAGDAPCNSYSATLEVPYPWFETGPITATKRACPDLAAESAFFETLTRATLSEVLGDVLILSDPNGPLMVFNADG